jgi:hypothetical protein
MPFAVQSIPGCRIVDTDNKMTAALVRQVLEQGFAGIVRYVPLPGVGAAADIDAAELELILNAGLGIYLVQHSRFEGWDPTKASGQTDATTAIQFAKMAGYLPKAHIFLDLEGILVGAPAAGPTTFANDWADTIVAAGFQAGCYVGFDVPLSPQQLFDLHKVNSYWSDPGLRQVATRGFAVKQEAAIHIGGTSFDPDVVAPDELGDTPSWMISVAPAAVG